MEFWFRFGSVTGFFKPAPSPKPRQNSKILAPHRLHFFFKRSSFTILAQGAVRTLTDQEICTGLVGTWADSPSEHSTAHGKATYYADGHGFEMVWFDGQLESDAMRIDSRWSVTNSVLTLICVKSSNPQLAPVGITLKDRIVSISPDQFIFETIDYGDRKPHVKIRVTKQP